MTPKILCPSCSKEVALGDKFCSSCGTKLTWNESAAQSKESVNVEGGSLITCQMCGFENKQTSLYCESCGVPTGSEVAKQVESTKSKENVSATEKTPPLKSLQSWKITVAMAVIFIIVLVVLQSDEEKIEPAPRKVAPVQRQQPVIPQEMLQEVQALEEAVQQNPDDMQTQLRFANRLQDVRMFGRAVNEYQKYLVKNPTDPNARVDLGVSYFELSLLDSVKHHEYLMLAEKEMETALQHDPKHQMGYFNLGIVSLHMGNMDKAKNWFQQCATLDSTTETGQKAKMLIQQHSFNNPS
ncbi:MAG: zinc ribbon domain-containing protein [Ignavibacteriae bacterium]|nr:zinc ribbon domain-containing protein [Ignavibacteriota bacterium]